MTEETYVDLVIQVKELLAEPRHRITLHDLIVKELKVAIERISSLSECGFAERLGSYEEMTRGLRQAVTCISYWGEESHRGVLTLVHSRIAELTEADGGSAVQNDLKWYPLALVLYSAGIGALAARKYATLSAIFSAKVLAFDHSGGRVSLMIALDEIFTDMNRRDRFSTIPGLERHYVPRSEYVLNLLRMEFEDLLFLGQEYEECFDQFEVLIALLCGHFRLQNERDFWAPMGRFAWKARSGNGHPLQRLLLEASNKRGDWEPFRVGLLPMTYERFEEMADGLQKAINRLQWY